MDDRYQNQPWYIRLWRRRWLLKVPLAALSTWRKVRGTKIDPTMEDCRYYTFNDIWGLELGTAHVKMKWYYSSDELLEELRDIANS